MTFAEGGTEVLSHIRIHYTSDTNKDYVDGLTKATTLGELQRHVHTYQRVADDAWKIAQEMDAAAFHEWRTGLRMERKRQFAGEQWAERYGALLMPRVLMEVEMVSNHFKAPWGCAYIRLKEEGIIKEVNHIAQWIGWPKKDENNAQGKS